MDLIEALNNTSFLEAANKIIAPAKSNTKTGSFILMLAVLRWSGNTLAPVAWAGNKDIEYYGTSFYARLKSHSAKQTCPNKEVIAYVSPEHAGIDIGRRAGEYSGYVDCKFPKYKHVGYTQRISDVELSSISDGNEKYKAKIDKLVNLLARRCGPFRYEESSLCQSLGSIIQNELGLTYVPEKPTVVNKQYAQVSKLGWHTTYANETSYKSWPAGMSKQELFNYLNDTIESPECPRLVVINLKLYARKEHFKLTDDDWDKFSVLFNNCAYIDNTIKNQIRGIERLPVKTQYTWIKSLIGSYKTISPYTYDALEKLTNIENLSISQLEKLSTSADNFSRATTLVQFAHYVKNNTPNMPLDRVDELSKLLIGKSTSAMLYFVNTTGSMEHVFGYFKIGKFEEDALDDNGRYAVNIECLPDAATYDILHGKLRGPDINITRHTKEDDLIETVALLQATLRAFKSNSTRIEFLKRHNQKITPWLSAYFKYYQNKKDKYEYVRNSKPDEFLKQLLLPPGAESKVIMSMFDTDALFVDGLIHCWAQNITSQTAKMEDINDITF